ncbi:hypothetical protein SH501x_001901 [Pirellulaceae bacterium SH501]
MKPTAWVGVSAYDCAVPVFHSRHIEPELILVDAGLSPHLDAPAHVFAIGANAGAGHFVSSLGETLASANTNLEFVASLVPGKLAVCYGHAYEIGVCKASQ